MLGERHYRSCLNLKGSLSRVSMSLVSVFIGKSCNRRHHVLPPLCKPFFGAASLLFAVFIVDSARLGQLTTQVHRATMWVHHCC